MVASGGDFKTAMIGGMMAWTAFNIAHSPIGKELFNTSTKQVLAHGVSQGAFAEMRGGKFKEGFLGAVVAKMMPVPDAVQNSGVAGRTTFAALSGGIASELGGGKFKNGAVSAAFVHLFNDMVSGPNKRPQTREGAIDELIYGPTHNNAPEVDDRLYLGEVNGMGDFLEVDAGKIIELEPYSHTSGIDMFRVNINYRFYDLRGKLLPMAAPLNLFGKPIPAFSPGVASGANTGVSLKFEAFSTEFNRVRWHIRIPYQRQLNELSTGWNVRVYEVRN